MKNIMPNRWFRALKEQAGTSLMEVLLASSLTVILLTAAYSVAIGAIGSFNTTVARADAQSTAQDAVTVLARDIRQAEKPLLYVYSMPGYYEQLVFRADLNDDGTAEAILYEFHVYTRRVTRKVNLTGANDFYGTNAEVISEDIANNTGEPVFTYYGSDNDTPLVLTDPTADVINKSRNIQIRLVIDEDPNKAPARVELNTNVKLRNFAYGATR